MLLDKCSSAVVGAAAAGMFVAFGPGAVVFAANVGLKLTELYSIIFDLFTVVTGLLFAFYGIITTAETPFMKAMKRTEAYKTFKAELKAGLFTGMGVTIYCIPLIVVGPLPVDRGLWTWVVAVWLGAAVAGFWLFGRVVRGFIYLADNIPDRPASGG